MCHLGYNCIISEASLSGPYIKKETNSIFVATLFLLRMRQTRSHLLNKLSKCPKWKVLYAVINALVTVSSAVSSFTETLDIRVPKNKADMLSETRRAKSYDGSWSRTVKIWTISNDKVTDILIRLMERPAVWLSEWAAELPGQNRRGAGSSCKLLAFLWTEDWKRLRRQGASSRSLRHTTEE